MMIFSDSASENVMGFPLSSHHLLSQHGRRIQNEINELAHESGWNVSLNNRVAIRKHYSNCFDIFSHVHPLNANRSTWKVVRMKEENALWVQLQYFGWSRVNSLIFLDTNRSGQHFFPSTFSPSACRLRCSITELNCLSFGQLEPCSEMAQLASLSSLAS